MSDYESELRARIDSARFDLQGLAQQTSGKSAEVLRCGVLVLDELLTAYQRTRNDVRLRWHDEAMDLFSEEEEPDTLPALVSRLFGSHEDRETVMASVVGLLRPVADTARGVGTADDDGPTDEEREALAAAVSEAILRLCRTLGFHAELARPCSCGGSELTPYPSHPYYLCATCGSVSCLA